MVFKTTNNEVKYETLFFGLMIAKSLDAKEVEVQADFQVVVNQVLGELEAKSEKLKKYLRLVEVERAHFGYFQIQQVLRVENQKPDKLE